MLKSYSAIFHKEDDGSFWVEFPGFGGVPKVMTLKKRRKMLEKC